MDYDNKELIDVLDKKTKETQEVLDEENMKTAKSFWNIRCYFYDLMMKENKKNPGKCTWKSNLYCKLSGIFWKITYKLAPESEWCFDMFEDKNV